MHLKTLRDTPTAKSQSFIILNLNAAELSDHLLLTTQHHVRAVLEKLTPKFHGLYEEQAVQLPPNSSSKPASSPRFTPCAMDGSSPSSLGQPPFVSLFFGRELADSGFDQHVYANNYELVISAEEASLFFAELYHFYG